MEKILTRSERAILLLDLDTELRDLCNKLIDDGQNMSWSQIKFMEYKIRQIKKRIEINKELV